MDAVHNGPVVTIMSQCAEFEIGETVHSKGQLEHFSVIVGNTSHDCGSKQCMIVLEGHAITAHIQDGLPCIGMRKIQMHAIHAT